MLEIGKKYRVKSSLKIGTYGENNLYFGKSMESCMGTIVTICGDVYLGKRFSVLENCWIWCEEMLEPLKINKIKVKDFLKDI